MPAANEDKNKAARVLYQQIVKEVEELAGDAFKDAQDARLHRLEQVAKIYAYVAEASVTPST
ncbi:hypothetical protein MB901379_03881 [Mycobacterium basiliense]|uniref:Uncharacterized protein n=1 Tax=Mycobacterium basiliense TaxID=2094119 RepID=A0A3S4DVN3_9MYCO|nr:hypothetical protein [Mycobacterium basiliense]VDM90285.1 hypothetical protein MB901379_03881 [Mycobacterium basiliense]